MARQTNSSRAVHAIDLPQELQFESPTTGRIERNPSLPVYRKGSNYFKNDISRPRLRDTLGHLIPMVLVLCLFILWWFSQPVDLERKSERIFIVVGKEDMSEPVNVTNAHPGSLTSTSTPYISIGSYARISKKSSRAERAVSTSKKDRSWSHFTF